MSNNSNNIYNILGKLEALKPTAQEKHAATVKAIYESVEAQGSIIEGVDAVQARLLKEFAEGKDEGKPGKNFAKIAKSAAERYGSKEAGNRVAGAVKAKLAKQGKLEETNVEEKAPPGAKAERMVKHIKQGYAKDGKLTDKEKAIAYATTWKAHNKGQVEEAYNPVAAVKQCAKNAMEMNGIASVHDLDAEDIEYIGDECQMNYHDVCEILGIQLPDSLGPVQSWDTDEQGNKFDLEEGTCNECGMYESKCSCDHTNEAEITRKPGVTTHRKTDFPGYPADDINDPDVEPTDRKRGRPRKHAAKAPTGLGRGRPTKAKAPTFSKQADPFGRVSGTVPSGKKGTVHTMAESMETLGRRLIEGINFANMMKETDQNIDELMNELQNDIKEYKATGHCSDKLKDFMQVHAHSKKQMADETAALVAPKPPMAPAGGIHGNFMDPMSAKDQKAKMNPPRTLEDVTMEEELNELAKLAGLGEATRGSYIKQQDTAAEKAGKDKFHAFGQEFDTDKVEEEEETDEGNTFGNEVRKAKADGIQPGEKIEVDGKTYPVKESTSFDGDESSDFNISTSMSSDGDKNVTVSATGEHAASLLQMLRIAGLGGGDKAQELQQPQQEPGVEVISIDGEEGIEEESIDVDQPKVAPQNAPNEKYGTIKNITTQGDDLNREKRQDPATANKAANPMTNAQSVLKSVAQLESKLSAEYESIKKVSK